MKFVIIKRSWIIYSALCFVLVMCSLLFFRPNALPVDGETSPTHDLYTFHMVTGEFSSEDDSGNEIESYRFDPGTIVVPKEEEIKLSILGVNGKEHPFIIEGTNAKGVVEKGKETILTLKFSKEGTYRLICTAHPDADHNGPMIGYIVVK
ncbi:cupredoxin domain-containing protein [Bacillus pinisoli]|uniref:cupredoxin domain-containing protein n=1 Tax=Bacillus pinisoli TaxID=2901866 RepID=UPI001FF17518|nr:cupredoxin domain-containing protein [Bacillus pinisoli]